MNIAKFSIGDIYGELTIIEDKGIRNSKRHVLVKCSCGNEVVTLLTYMRSGQKKSCGCLWQRAIKKSNTVHGDSKSRLYRIYSAMKDRCNFKGHKHYKNYGGRGVKVCEPWLSSYKEFRGWALENGYDDSLTLDRIDNDGNYSPENCRWVSQKEQMRNTRINVYVTIGDETKTVIEWCEKFGVNPHTAYTRIKRGWNHVDAVSKKPKK